MKCNDCQDTGRLFNMTCHCQATSELTRTCVKCNTRKPLTVDYFDKADKEDMCNRGYMNKYQKKICKLEYKPNCYILISGSQKPLDDTFGEIRVKPNISFLYDAGDVAAEWEPEHGPIQVWRRCNENDNGAKEHYFYDWHNSKFGNWSQLAVDDNKLPSAFINGRYNYIFDVLKKWAKP